jgi:hypothetical protein
MTDERHIELFILKCAVIEAGLQASLEEYPETIHGDLYNLSDDNIEKYIRQFQTENRANAAKMGKYYQIFYMLENDIRDLISETLETAHGAGWWNTCVPDAVKQEAIRNRDRETEAGVSLRSDLEIDYITFGQLGDIISANWRDFAGILSNQSAVRRVLSGLNMLRGTIAHCGMLAEDEVDRLKLAIRDWFRVLEGPKAY